MNCKKRCSFLLCALAASAFLFAQETPTPADDGARASVPTADSSGTPTENNETAATAAPASAATPLADGASAPAAGGTVSDIRIVGLKKTRNSHMQALLKKYRDIPADELDLHAVETTLQQIGLFEQSEVATETGDDGSTVLVITVKEKLSFIPLPFAASSNGSFMGGGFVMDTNAFGVQDMVMVGAFFSKTLMMGMANFSKPSLALTKPGFSFGGSASKNTATFCNLDEDEILQYDFVGFNVHAAVSDRLTEHSQASIGIAYGQSSIEAGDGYEDADVESYKAFSVSSSWGMSVADWNGYFLSTNSLSVSGVLRFYTDSTKAPSAAARLSVEQPLLTPRLRFVAHTSGALWHNEHISQLGGGSSVGVAILPDDFHSAKLAGASGGFEFAFAKTRLAMFSLYASYQAAYAEDSDDTMRLTHGVTGGTRMYLSKIAFPALAFGVAYNVPLHLFKYSFAFGVSM